MVPVTEMILGLVGILRRAELDFFSELDFFFKAEMATLA